MSGLHLLRTARGDRIDVMRYGLVLLIFLLIAGCQSAAPEKKVQTTVIHDKHEAELLRGRHLFTDRGSLGSTEQLTFYKYLDTVKITNDNGLYRINGKHERYYNSGPPKLLERGGYIKIDGVITEIRDKAFVFRGDFREKLLNVYKGPHIKCHNTGPITFVRKDHWRAEAISKLVHHRHEIWENEYSNNIVCNQGLEGFTTEIFVSNFQGEPPSGDARRLDER